MKKLNKFDSGQPTCENCGGIHFGSPRGFCPYINEPCVICGEGTIYACSDCGIDSGGKTSVHVCEKGDCQRKHEEKARHSRSNADLMPHKFSA